MEAVSWARCWLGAGVFVLRVLARLPNVQEPRAIMFI